jgi:hypothetical protein
MQTIRKRPFASVPVYQGLFGRSPYFFYRRPNRRIPGSYQESRIHFGDRSGVYKRRGWNLNFDVEDVARPTARKPRVSWPNEGMNGFPVA